MKTDRAPVGRSLEWQRQLAAPYGSRDESLAARIRTLESQVAAAEAVITAYEAVRRLGMLSKPVDDEAWLAASDRMSKAVRAYRAEHPRQS